jgi:hypothetical protein
VSHFFSHGACLESALSVGSETVIGMTAILCYARVSTTGQDLDAQLAALTAAGVETDRAFTDVLSGSAKQPARVWPRCWTTPAPATP